MSGVRDRIGAGQVAWLAILRLVLCLAVAEVLGLLLPLDRPYWIVLTIAVVLKPDFGSVFARAVQRGLGTVVGVLIGSVLLVVLPFGWPILVAMAVFAFLMPVSIRRNYGMFATFLKPLVVLLLDLVHHDDQSLVLARLVDTLIGSAIVLIVGYLPWPDTWRSRSRIGERLADATDAAAGYIEASFDPHETARPGIRRRTYRQLADLRTVFQQTMAERPPISNRAVAWWPAIVALERLTDATTATVLDAKRGEPAPTRDGVRSVLEAMDDLAGSIRSGRRPRPLQLPEEDALAGIAAELSIAHSVLSGRPRPASVQHQTR